jgi:outer membrane protein OmpA-like peptidoglycan-associated protein
MLMVVCPVCQKMTAANFMWHSSDTDRMCLMCHHSRPKDAVRTDSGAKLTKATSVTTEFAVKIGGTFAGVLALIVGGIYLFYKPKPMQPPPPLAHAKVDKADGKNGTGGTFKQDDKAAAEGVVAGGGAPGDKTGGTNDGKKATVSVAAAVSGRKERMAATVQALISDIPQAKAKTAADAAAAKPGALSGAGAMAASMGINAPSMAGPGATNLNPNKKTKEKLLTAKDSVLAVAAAVIDKNDADGTKTADALAKLGAVSTTFADVAAKLTEGAPGASQSGGASSKGGMGGVGGLGGTTTGTTKLEGDILEAQGRAGYDVMDLMKREADAADGKAAKTVKVETDPEAVRRKIQADRAEALQKALQNTAQAMSPRGKGTQEKTDDGKQAAGVKSAAAVHTDLVAKLNDLQLKLNDPSIKLNDLGLKLNDLATKLNDPAIKLNNPTIKLNDLTIKLHDLATKLNDPATNRNDPSIKLNDLTIRLHDVAIRLNDTAVQLNVTTMKMNDTATRLNATAVKLHDPTIALNVTAIRLNNLLCSMSVQPEAARQGSTVVQRTETAMKLKSLPANFAAAAGASARVPADKKAKAARSADIPVLILSMRADVLFDAESAALRKEAAAGLAELAGLMGSQPGQPVLIRSYTAGKGKPEAVRTLSKKRGEAVLEWLMAHSGITAKNTSVQGLTAGEPATAKKKSKGTEATPSAVQDQQVTVTIPQTPAKTLTSAIR